MPRTLQKGPLYRVSTVIDEFLANDQITKNSLVSWTRQIYQNSTGLLLHCTCINKNDRQFMAL